MEHYLLLRIVHAASAVLLLLGVLAHFLMLWKASRRGDAEVLQRKLRNTRRFSLPALAVVGASLPVTGWWLTHLAGWPLGQLWLLASSILLLVLLVLGLLLAGRLRAWQLAVAPVPANVPRLAAVYAGLMLLVLLAIFGLMGAKPV
jgi:uncharacterized membrane protein